jgi:subtilase family serine protease
MPLRTVIRRALSFPVVIGCVVVACVLPVAIKAQTISPATPRIVERVDEGRLTTLSGNTRPEARAEYDRGPVAPGLPMPGMVLVLRRGPEQQRAFDAFVASQYEAGSPNFHHWLTPDEVGKKFGPAQADLDVVKNWLLNHGFTVDSVSKNRLSIRFSGNASQVESAFHTQIHNLQVKGESHIANMTDSQIPSALTPVVVGVEALHNFFPRPLHKLGAQVRRNAQTGTWERISNPASHSSEPAAHVAGAKEIGPLFGTGGTPATIEDVAPYDFATIYNVLPLWQAATPIDGTGQSIAIVGTSNINPADVTAFRAAFGLPAYSSASGASPSVTVIVPPGTTDPGACPGYTTSCQDALIENSLDVEWAGAIAKNASIILVASSPGSGTTFASDPVYISSDYIVQNNLAPIMNVSYGECELGLGTAGNASYNILWQTAASEGIAVFVATGDDGSATCDAGGDSSGLPYGAQFGLSVSGVASTPWDTAVGGTDFTWGWVANGQTTYWQTSNNSANASNALGYIPEIPWNSTCSNPLFIAEINTEIKENYGAAEMCNAFGTGQITSNGQPVYTFVDTVGAGGGASGCTTNDGSHVTSCKDGYSKPSWQANVTGIPSDGKRDIPDVSFFAANGFSGSAYVICVSGAGSCSYTQDTEPEGEEIGGTSVASPIMASVMALINQKAGSAQGNPNPQLYKLAFKETYSGCSTEAIPVTGSSCIFNDIDQGTNAMPCDIGTPDCTGSSSYTYGVLSSYAATVGFDLATGLGSMNVANLVQAYANASNSTVDLSSDILTFASTPVGQSAATQSVTLKNNGPTALAISGITVKGADATSFSETNTCGSSLAASASCTVTVTFTPTAAGTLTATVAIGETATSSPMNVTLIGPSPAATAGSFTLSASTPATIAPGSSATSTITAKPSGGYTGTITLTCSVAPVTGGTDTPTCAVGAPIAVTAGAATSTVTVSTTGPSTLARPAKSALAQRGTGSLQGWLGAGGTALACMLLLGVPARRRDWKSLLGVLVFMVGLGTLAGCGGGSGGGTVTQPIPGTTAGSYTVTVTGTDSKGSTQTTTFTVTVN